MIKQFLIYGYVQGVGFRYFTWKKATEMGIKGWVRNRSDGSVEAVAQGSPQQLSEFDTWLRQGTKTGYVETVLQQDYPHEQSFQDFTIRR